MAATRENQLPVSVKQRSENKLKVFSKLGIGSQVRGEDICSPFLSSLFYHQEMGARRETRIPINPRATSLDWHLGKKKEGEESIMNQLSDCNVTSLSGICI